VTALQIAIVTGVALAKKKSHLQHFAIKKTNKFMNPKNCILYKYAQSEVNDRTLNLANPSEIIFIHN